ncbi:hypothetical protein [Motilimonas eburnea]|uniref:hypothetical protein n=1 Tax=Motilimonas eburnea TaxID=1737488 RepID=UPI001E510EEA|nr:hypothetical protein [Motilimonas eburnea]MCE2571870.1 hypothetical protein [Motilimonas eburnea]
MVNRDISQFIKRCDESFRLGQAAFHQGEQLEHCPWGDHNWHQAQYSRQWKAGWLASQRSALRPLDIKRDILIESAV